MRAQGSQARQQADGAPAQTHASSTAFQTDLWLQTNRRAAAPQHSRRERQCRQAQPDEQQASPTTSRRTCGSSTRPSFGCRRLSATQAAAPRRRQEQKPHPQHLHHPTSRQQHPPPLTETPMQTHQHHCGCCYTAAPSTMRRAASMRRRSTGSPVARGLTASAPVPAYGWTRCARQPVPACCHYASLAVSPGFECSADATGDDDAPRNTERIRHPSGALTAASPNADSKSPCLARYARASLRACAAQQVTALRSHASASMWVQRPRRNDLDRFLLPLLLGLLDTLFLEKLLLCQRWPGPHGRRHRRAGTHPYLRRYSHPHVHTEVQPAARAA